MEGSGAGASWSQATRHNSGRDPFGGARRGHNWWQHRRVGAAFNKSLNYPMNLHVEIRQVHSSPSISRFSTILDVFSGQIWWGFSTKAAEEGGTPFSYIVGSFERAFCGAIHLQVPAVLASSVQWFGPLRLLRFSGASFDEGCLKSSPLVAEPFAVAQTLVDNLHDLERSCGCCGVSGSNCRCVLRSEEGKELHSCSRLRWGWRFDGLRRAQIAMTEETGVKAVFVRGCRRFSLPAWG